VSPADRGVEQSGGVRVERVEGAGGHAEHLGVACLCGGEQQPAERPAHRTVVRIGPKRGGGLAVGALR
jgi:hypothetical protein